MTSQFDHINSFEAKEIATNFLQQQHSVYDLKITLEDGIWLVKAVTSSFGESVRKVRIDPRTGKIIGIE